MSNAMIQLTISGMHCASCVAGIESALNAVSGVESATVNFAAKTAMVMGTAKVDALIAAVQAQGYEATLAAEAAHQHAGAADFALYRQRLWQALVAAVVGVPLLIDDFVHFIPAPDRPVTQWFWIVIGLIVYSVMWFSGRHIYRGFWQSIKVFKGNMDTLVGMGTGVAWLYSMIVAVIPGLIPAMARNTYFDTTALLLAFVTFGNALEMKAQGKSSQAIQRLMGLQPKTAHVMRDGKAEKIAISEIQPKDVLQLRPGEKVAVDGVVTEGESHLDESMLTGESLPLHKKTGDAIYAGTVNKTGALLYRATGVGQETVLSRIIATVQQAQNSKPEIGRLVDKVASVFVPIVLLCMALTVMGWCVWGPEPTAAYVLTTAVAVLVIACPCALGLATPLSIMVGVGKAADNGLLIRQGDSLQLMSRLDTVVLDKTGTITVGEPAVVGVYPVDGEDEASVLSIAGSLEAASEHPLAEAVNSAVAAKGLSVASVEDFQALSGLGVTGRQNAVAIGLGNAVLMQQLHIETQSLRANAALVASQGQTPVYVARGGKLLGLLAIADPIKPDSKAAIQTLQSMGIYVVMLTGDHEQTANAIASQVGVDQVIAGVLPDQKAAAIETLQADNQRVAMVGDGINDAPALTQAHVGIAMGAGADVAIEAADMALMRGSLSGVIVAIQLSRATMRNIKENLLGAFLYNSIGIPLAAGVFYPVAHWLLSPLIAGAAMALSSLTVVLNANRLRFYRIKSQ